MSTTHPLEAGTDIVVDGLTTHLHDAGAGHAVLLLHGSGPGVSAWANWRLLLPRLAGSFRVVAPDQIGFNLTRPPAGDPRPYGRAAWTAHALGVLDALGIERAHVVGNSMGGAIALSMAAARPEAVDRIVVMGTMGVPGTLPPGLDELWGYTPSRDAMRRAIGLLTADADRINDELVELRYRASIAPGIDEAWQAMFPAPRQRWFDDLALSEDELRRIDRPVLLVHGLRDQVIPFSESTLPLMDVLPDARMHVFGGAGHWVQIERRDEFAALVEGFLTTDDPTDPTPRSTPS